MACWPTSRSTTVAAGGAKSPVSKRDLEQWFFRITQYADDLLDFSEIDWPERIVSMQTNWIGRSEGVEFDLPVDGHPDLKISRVHDARRHGVRHDLRRPGPRASAGRAVDRARTTEPKSRRTSSARGMRPTSSACRPSAKRRVCRSAALRSIRPTANGCRSGSPTTCWPSTARARSWPCRPLTSATGSLPAQFDLPIRVVVRPPDAADDITAEQLPGNTAYVDPGVMVNSGQFNGLPNEEAWEHIADWFEAARHRPPAASTTACATGWSRASATGVRRSRSSTARRTASCRCPRTSCRSSCPQDVEFQSSDDRGLSNPLATSASFRQHHLPDLRRAGASARRTPWTRSWIRRGTSCATRRPTTSRGRSTRQGPVLAAGRPVHGRRRARRDAPAVQPLLHARAQGPGPGRLSGAVQAPVQPGRSAGPGRQAHVQEPRQRGQSGRARRALRRRRGARLAGVPGSVGPGRPDQRERAGCDPRFASRHLEPDHRADAGAGRVGPADRRCSARRACAPSRASARTSKASASTSWSRS